MIRLSKERSVIMNDEVIKAINRKNKKHPIRDWWNKNDYKVIRIILFPIYILVQIYDKINSKLDARTKWSDEQANKILNYYIPRQCSWDEEYKELYFFDNGYGWYMNKKRVKWKDRRFWNKYKGWYGGEIRDYLLNKFELEGFTKELGKYEGGRTEIIFHKINED